VAGTATVMQAVESETLILYQTDLRGQWPQDSARALAARLPYLRRLAANSGSAAAHASLAGIALALRALGRVLGRTVAVDEIVMAQGEKPRMRATAATAAVAPATQVSEWQVRAPRDRPDFSISHSGPWVGCAVVARGRVGLDIEMGTDARIGDWVVREAVLKASGEGLRAADEVRGLELRDAGVQWQGELWHLRRLDLFAGASACVSSSRMLEAVDAHTVSLAELFAP
jgi:phosphopantetheinyl transferase